MKKRVWTYQLPFVFIFTMGLYIAHLDDMGSLQNQTVREYILPPFKMLSNKFTDMKFLMRGQQPKKNKIVVVGVDSDAIEELGRWPWTRDYVAHLIDQSFKAGAKVVGMDMVFSEADERIPKEIKSILEQNEMLDIIIRNETDYALASTIGQYSDKLVLGWASDTTCIPRFDDQCAKYIDDPQFLETIPSDFQAFRYKNQKMSEDFDPKKTPLMSFLSPIPNLSLFRASATHNGTFNVLQEADGTVRRYNLAFVLGKNIYPSLALSMAKVGLGKDLSIEVNNQTNITSLKLGEQKLEASPTGQIGINFRGKQHVFPYVSALDVIRDVDEIRLIEGGDKIYSKKELFKDAYVFIAATAIGVNDLRSFPYEENIPGVEGHVNALDNILSNDYMRLGTDFQDYLVMFIIMFLGGMIFTYYCGTLRPAPALIFFVSVMTVIGIVDIFVLFRNNYNWQSGFLFAELNLIYFCSELIKFIQDEKDKRFLRKAFSNYISPELVQIMTSAEKLPHLGGATRQLTAFFTDIQSFSTFSEKLTPDELVNLLNEYLTVMTDILIESKGTLDKYEGDAIIAFFGAPVEYDDHAPRACHTALKMQEGLDRLRIKWESEGDKWPDYVKHMRMRIGINTGAILCGNMGSRDRMNYTMMGDNVNLAARLEGAGKQYGVFILVSEETIMRAGERFISREIDTIRVVGRSQPVKVFELLGEVENISDSDMQIKMIFEEALRLYKDQKFDEAIKKFEECIPLEHHADPEFKKDLNPSLVYIQRCEHFKQDPPPRDWDGIFVLDEK